MEGKWEGLVCLRTTFKHFVDIWATARASCIESLINSGYNSQNNYKFFLNLAISSLSVHHAASLDTYYKRLILTFWSNQQLELVKNQLCLIMLSK